jgi:glucose/arabinose dehydrogenase
VTATRLRSLVLLGLTTLTLLAVSPRSGIEPRFVSGEAVFPVAGDLDGVVLQPMPGARGLAFPVSLTSAGSGDSRIFLTLRDGRIVILQNGSVLPTPFLDIRGLVGTDGEGGLLSVAFHPRFAENGFFFVNYTDRGVDNTIVARYQVSQGDPNKADPASGRVLLRIGQPFTNHNGGQLQFGPDGFLYIGMGDGGAGGDPDCRAQRDDTLLGKMLRIDVDQSVNSSPFYGIPNDNPFRGNDGVPDEVWARGLRNPWRFSFDRGTGDLYIGDVGQSTREEIDRQPAGSPGGENYGWKVMEGSLCFSRDACPASVPACNSPALTLPVLEYQNTGSDCAVMGGYVYRGSQVPQLRGTYLFGDLCSNRIWGARQRQDGTWEVRRLAGAESVLAGEGLVAFGEDNAGEVYVVTSSAIYRIATGPARPARRGEGNGIKTPAR